MSYHYATELYGAYGEGAVNAAFQKMHHTVPRPALHYARWHDTSGTHTHHRSHPLTQLGNVR
jgi:hypothetical protein